LKVQGKTQAIEGKPKHDGGKVRRTRLKHNYEIKRDLHEVGEKKMADEI
jgi:hypothetical protein